MARKKSGAAEDLFEIVAMFPWWVGVVLALVAYVFLHGVAGSPVTAPLQAGQMGQFVGQQLYKTFALFGQYLLPLICLAGAAASAVGRASHRGQRRFELFRHVHRRCEAEAGRQVSPTNTDSVLW